MMSDEVQLCLTDQNVIQIKGEMTFFTVRMLWNQSQNLMRDLKKVEVNLQNVTHCDSSGLALLIELKRYAKQYDLKIQLTHIPEQLTNIAQLLHLDLS